MSGSEKKDPLQHRLLVFPPLAKFAPPSKLAGVDGLQWVEMIRVVGQKRGADIIMGFVLKAQLL